MKTVLLTFENEKKRDAFLKILHEAAATFIGAPSGKEDLVDKGKLIKEVLGTVRLDPPIRPDNERQCALFVGGEKILEGTLDVLRKRFSEECGVHKGSVTVKELRDGIWTPIMKRTLQRK